MLIPFVSCAVVFLRVFLVLWFIEPPVVEMTPKVVKVYSGTTVNLTCQGVSIDPDVEPVVLSISKGTIPSCFRTQYLQEGPFSATGPTANAVLPFPAIGRFDSGWYYCEATTPYLLGCSDSKSKQAMKVDVVGELFCFL